MEVGIKFKKLNPPTRRNILIAGGALTVIVVLYLGFCLYVISSALTPHRKVGPTPIDSGIAAEPISFQSDVDHVPLVGWLLPSSGDRAIVLVHGLDSHSWDGGQPDVAQAYVKAGFHVLVFDLRGHGRSGEAHLGLGWLERRDVRAAVDLLLERGFKPGRIGIHGGSYGAATALLSTAVIPELAAVVADSAFADMRDLMDAQIETRRRIPSWFSRLFLRPGFAFVAQLFYSLDFTEIPPERAVPEIAPRPILFIHGSEDRYILLEHAYRLKAASKNSADELWILEGYGHTEGVRLEPDIVKASPMREEYLRRVPEFFTQEIP